MKKTYNQLFRRWSIKVFLLVVAFSNIETVCLSQDKSVDSLRSEILKQPSSKHSELFNQLADAYLLINLDSSEVFAKRALAIAKKESNTTVQIESHSILASIYSRRGELGNAEELTRQSLDLLMEDDFRIKCDLLSELAIIYKKGTNFDSAIYYFEKSISLAEFHQDSMRMALPYFELGSIELMRDELSRAQKYFIQSTKLTESYPRLRTIKEKNKFGNVRWMNTVCLGVIKKRLNELDSALYYYDLTLDYASNNKYALIAIYGNIANIHDRRTEYGKATENLIKALKIAEEIDDQVSILTCLNNLADVSVAIKDFMNAEKYYNRTLETSIEIQDLIGEILSYAGLGIVYRETGRHTDAIKVLLKGLHLSDSLNIRSETAKLNSILGQVYIEQEKYQLAYRKFAESYTIIDSLETKSYNCSTINYLGVSSMYLEKYKEAIQYASEALLLSKEDDDMEQIMLSYQVLSESYVAIGDPTKAYQALKMESIYKDSILNEEKLRAVNELQIQYETEKTKQEIESLNQQALIRNLELEKANLNRTILIALILFLLLAATIYYLINRQQKLDLKQKTQDVEQRLLRVQMNPHFIFNAMSSIQEFMLDGEINSAGQYLTKFSRLIRQVLDNSRSEFISLDNEINMLDNYLTLQNIQRKVPIKYDIVVSGEIDKEELGIPPMFAQPFVENAIEHGLINKPDEAKIEIEFRQEKEFLRLKISDNGVGIGSIDTRKREGHISHAMKITEERVMLYKRKTKKHISFDVETLSQGTRVVLNLPFIYV